MSDLQLTSKSRLHGIKIFLSASIPKPERSLDYLRIAEAPIRIEEAVMCIARAIFMEGGTLVFGAHPSISPLVARVINDYYLPAPAEELIKDSDQDNQQSHWKNPSLLIYQSKVWKKCWAEATERLTWHPLVQLEWTETMNDETVDCDVKDRSQAPKSLERMRISMLEKTSPAAMIAIGGMEGVQDEAALFAKLRPGKPIYALETTGGAAAKLKDQNLENVKVKDQEVMELLRQFWQQQDGTETQQRFSESDNPLSYIPYAFVAQQIVAEIINNRG